MEDRGDTGARGVVLYLEDQPANVRLIERVLERRAGVELVAKRSGLEGIAAASRRHPDLILLDLHLPDLDGEEVIARLRADEATADVPVVVLSADAREERMQAALAAGAARFLTKPLDLTDVLATVDEYVGRRESPSPR